MSRIPDTSRPTVASFWHDLPREGRLMLSTVAVNALGNGLVIPFGVVYLHQVRHFSLETTGVLMALPATVALLLLGPLGALIDRVGPRRVQASSLVVQIAGLLLLSRAATVPDAAAALAVIGVGQAAFWPASQSLVAAVVPEAVRQRYFGVSFTLLNAGMGAGGLTAGLLVSVDDPATFTRIYLADAVTFLVPLAVLLGPLRHVGGPEVGAGPPAASGAAAVAGAASEPASYRLVLRDRAFRGVLAVVFVSAFVGYAQFEAGWTAYASVVAQASPSLIGVAFAVNTATIVALQLVVLQRIEGRRRTRVLLVMSGVWAVSWLLLGLAGVGPGTLVSAVLVVASMLVFALGETLLSPVAPALTNDLASPVLRGRYNATSAAVFQLAAISGPVAAGQLLGRQWPAAFIAMILLGCAATAALLLWLERRLPRSANGLRDLPVPAPVPALDPELAPTPPLAPSPSPDPVALRP